jgi:hypothetical protein
MGIASSKDESGKAILGSLPPGFLDGKGRALRDELDACLGRSMWFFSLAGVAVALPLCVRYRTERPLMAAAITCPVLDMMYGELFFCVCVFVGFFFVFGRTSGRRTTNDRRQDDDDAPLCAFSAC